MIPIEPVLNAAQVEGIIYQALTAINAERDPSDHIPLESSTPLFGVDADLDSLSFVSLITDVEMSLAVDHGLEVALADDRALSRAESPYATIASLRDYVLELLA